jgi:SAM-dependent methyltransferase
VPHERSANATYCRACGNDAHNKVHSVREMLYGTNDYFEYVECRLCGSLSIYSIPEDIGRYYPEDYYSKAMCLGVPLPSWKFLLKRQRAKYWLNSPNLIGRVLARGESAPWFIRCFRRVEAGIDDRILDIGCGSGSLLIDMAAEGFTNLTGVDPFISSDITYANGVKIYKKQIAELGGHFDVIMFNDSFEHLPDPGVALVHTRRLLDSRGTVIIRTPVADSFAWHHYGTYWHKLEAPRHLIIYTRKSLTMLAKDAGFRVIHSQDESSEVQFWKSEACKQGVPLIEARQESHPAELLHQWRLKAEGLNTRGEGDRVCFYLTAR